MLKLSKVFASKLYVASVYFIFSFLSYFFRSFFSALGFSVLATLIKLLPHFHVPLWLSYILIYLRKVVYDGWFGGKGVVPQEVGTEVHAKVEVVSIKVLYYLMLYSYRNAWRR